MLATPIYAALFAFLFVALSVRTLRLRRSERVSVGHGESTVLLRAMRAHANFAEYVPITLIILYFAELRLGAFSPWIHVAGIALLVGRVVHALGISQVKEDHRFRVAGMALTFTVLCSAAAAVLILSVLEVQS